MTKFDENEFEQPSEAMCSSFHVIAEAAKCDPPSEETECQQQILQFIRKFDHEAEIAQAALTALHQVVNDETKWNEVKLKRTLITS